MFVHLVVVPGRGRFAECFGADAVHLLSSEVLIGREDRHFPEMRDERVENLTERYLSRQYLAAVLLGSTDWSGWSDRRGAYWRATTRDLTPYGRRLHDSLRKLYPRCRLELLTWLDT